VNKDRIKTAFRELAPANTTLCIGNQTDPLPKPRPGGMETVISQSPHCTT